MYSLKVKGEDKYLPKTPYTYEESLMSSPLTTDPKRIGRYKHKGYAERLVRELKDQEFEIVILN